MNEKGYISDDGEQVDVAVNRVKFEKAPGEKVFAFEMESGTITP